MNDAEYFVYKHLFPNKKMYIGITSQKPKKRWSGGHGYKTSVLMDNAIKKYGWQNIKHIILYQNLTKKEAEKIEMKLIKKYKTNQRKYGYNIANGGKCIGMHSDLTKQKLSKAHKGKSLSYETKEKIRKANSGKNNYLFGKPMRKELKEKLLKANYKPILMFDKKNNLIQQFKCIKDAETKLKINNSNISQCCRGKRKTAGGFIWKYKEVLTYQ